jgi:hypothetical protein
LAFLYDICRNCPISPGCSRCLRLRFVDRIFARRLTSRQPVTHLGPCLRMPNLGD